MYRSLLVTGFLAVTLVASPVLAWHEVGHMLTMLVAYKQLSPGGTPSPAVKKLVAILKHHPRYQEDFAGSMPKGLSEDGEARWLLCRASVWPDQIRIDRENQPSYPPQPAKQGSYHRGVWHYIDTPLLIVAAGTSDDRSRHWKKGPRRPGLSDRCSRRGNGRQECAAGHRLQSREVRPRQARGTGRRPLLAAAHAGRHPSAAARDGGVFRRALDPATYPHGDAGGNAIRLAISGICTPFGMPRPTPAPNRL